MKVRNPHERAIIVTMVDEVREPRSIEVPAGETHETDDYVVASTLVEYGCVADPVDLQAAREAWADRNRDENSRTASASASEGAILGRQTTVDVSTGTVANGGAKVGELKGQALDDAVSRANDAGAGIASGLKADDKRKALVEWEARQDDEGGDYLTDESGDLVLDEDEQPILVSAVQHDEAGEPVFDDDGRPVMLEDTDD